MNNYEFFDASTLWYQLKNMAKKVKDFESWEKHVKMRREYESVFRARNRTIKKLEGELAKAHTETVTVRKIWSRVMDDLEAEHKRKRNHYKGKMQSLARRL